MGGAVLGAFRLAVPTITAIWNGSTPDWTAVFVQGVLIALVVAVLLPAAEAVLLWFRFPRLRAEERVQTLLQELRLLESERAALRQQLETRPRPLICPKYLAAGRMSIQSDAQALRFDNIGNENAFNINCDDVQIGKARVQFGRVDSLAKDGGSDKPILKGYLDGKPFGINEPHSERILETAIYMQVMNVGTTPELDSSSEHTTIHQVIHSAIHPEETAYEWGPLVIRYEDSRGVTYHSNYLVRLSQPHWEVSLVHIESPTPVS